MTAYSFKSYAARERANGERVQLVTVKHGHPLNNDHRAPFSSGSTAARALLAHAQRQLSNGDTGPNYFNQLRQIHDGATISGERVKKRLQQRQARAANALSNSDVDLDGRKLVLAVEIAQVQAEIATQLLPQVTASGRSTDSVIDDVDVITRGALRAATALRTEGAELGDVDPNAWSRDLMERMALSPDVDHSNDASIVARFARLIVELEAELPLAVERDEPLWEIDDMIDPYTLAQTADRLSDAMGADFNPDDFDASEEIDAQARAAIYNSMSMDEREFAAKMIALTPQQRIEVGMQIVNSTPPLINLPEAELGQGRFDVRMATEEEAIVMESLIHWAGEQRAYPGPEKAFGDLDAMKSLTMSSGDLGVMTYGLAVANNPASISHATSLLRNIPVEDRVVIHADNPAVSEQLIAARNEALAAAGIDRPFQDGSDATRAFGGWTLPGNADRLLGDDPRDAQVFVASSDLIVAYNSQINLDVSGLGATQERLTNAKSAVGTAERTLADATAKADAARDQKLVADAKALDEAGKDSSEAWAKAEASVDAKSRAALDRQIERAKAGLRAAEQSVTKATAHLEKLERQNKSEAFRRSTPGDIARAQITEAAHRQGKLHQVFVPAMAGERTVVQTAQGALTEQRSWVAARKAETLLDGDNFRARDLRDALGAGKGSRFDGRRALTSTLVGGSNFFSEQKGAKKGLEALGHRIDALPKTGVILVDDNERNPVVQSVLARGRRLIHATAWRVTDRSTPMSDGRRITLSERKTELDLGVAVAKTTGHNGKETPVGFARQFAYQDLKDSTVVIHGGGQMSRATFDAIQKEAAARNIASHGLTQKQAIAIHADLVARGQAALNAKRDPNMSREDALRLSTEATLANLEAPRPAEAALARAIMQEALVDFADQVILGSDMGRDYHSANLIRLAVDTDKLASLVDKDGRAVDMETAREHALQYAPSIADNTRRDLGSTLALPTKGDYGQLILGALPGVDTQRAARIGEAFETLGDVMVAAELGEASSALPRTLHHELGRPAAWAAAITRANEIADYTQDARMDGLSATSENYPETLKAAGRTPMIYTLKDVDLNVPTVALVVGGNARPTEADAEAAKTIATEAHAKGWAVSLHMSGDASASIAKELAAMPEESRPRILLVGDGHPTAHGNAKVLDAVIAVAQAGGGYATVTAPLPRGGATEDQIKEGTFSYEADRRSALNFQARQASAVVMLKSTGNDMEMMAIKTAIMESKPIAAVGPVLSGEPSVTDLRFRGSEYSANRRLLLGGDSVSVMLENRHLAFIPNFIPDMTSQAENRYVPFEGSTAGQMNSNDRNQEEEIDRSAIESAGRISTTIEWGRAAQNIEDGRGVGSFIEAVEAGQVQSIEATQEQKNARSLANDARFLDTASRSGVSSEVRAIFEEMNDRSRDAIDADVQEQFLRQRSGQGR